MLEKMIANFFPCLLNILAVVYVLSKILNKKVNFTNYKTYLVVLALIIVNIVNYIYVDDFIRFLISTLAICMGAYILFRDDFHKIFIATIFEQIIMFVSEMLLMLIIIWLFKMDKASLFINIQGTLLINVGVSLIAIGLVNIKPLLKLMRRITSFICDMDGMHKYVLIIVLMVTLNVLLMFIYSSTENTSMLLINLSFILIYSYIVYASLSEKNKNMIFRTENKVLTCNLSEYERMLNHQREMNHENKNQLVVIKGMIRQNENAIEYIDRIIDENRIINDSLYKKTKHIPSGGMQGIIYQKMLQMGEKKIKANLNVNKNIKQLNFSKMKPKLNYDVCRILGVFLDNAIEETDTLKIRRKEIGISMYGENNHLIIKISNEFKGKLNLERMAEDGYTTKSKGHGYGLSLVKNIVEHNSKINWEKSINDNIFTQCIKIKM